MHREAAVAAVAALLGQALQMSQAVEVVATLMAHSGAVALMAA
jgi:hypothetical protein